jgi:hypothetical protein
LLRDSIVWQLFEYNNWHNHNGGLEERMHLPQFQVLMRRQASMQSFREGGNTTSGRKWQAKVATHKQPVQQTSPPPIRWLFVLSSGWFGLLLCSPAWKIGMDCFSRLNRDKRSAKPNDSPLRDAADLDCLEEEASVF